MKDDFVLPDFNIHVKLKDQSSKESVKNTLKFFYSILESDKNVRRFAASDHDDLSGQAEYIQNLSKKVNLKLLINAYENFFCTI